MIIGGHRGSNYAQENSLQAFSLAALKGCTLFETDLRITQDQVVILHHDESLGSMKIKQSSWPDLLAKNPNLCTLHDLLIYFQNQPEIRLNLEIKDPQALKPAITLIQQTSFDPQRIIWSSFHNPYEKPWLIRNSLQNIIRKNLPQSTYALLIESTLALQFVKILRPKIPLHLNLHQWQNLNKLQSFSPYVMLWMSSQAEKKDLPHLWPKIIHLLRPQDIILVNDPKRLQDHDS